MEQWARGQFNGEDPIASAIMNEGAIAQINFTDKLLELTYEQLEEAFSGDT